MSAISDGDGHTSVGRLIALSTVALCVLAPAVIWFWLSALAGKLVDVPASYIGFMSAAGALAISMYGITKYKE